MSFPLPNNPKTKFEVVVLIRGGEKEERNKKRNKKRKITFEVVVLVLEYTRSPAGVLFGDLLASGVLRLDLL